MALLAQIAERLGSNLGLASDLRLLQKVLIAEAGAPRAVTLTIAFDDVLSAQSQLFGLPKHQDRRPPPMTNPIVGPRSASGKSPSGAFRVALVLPPPDDDDGWGSKRLIASGTFNPT
jgi:hypothetical protein